VRVLWLALVPALLTSGCLWPGAKADPTQFFVLEARPVAFPPMRERPRVQLEPVELPAYLSNPRLAARTGANRIDYAEFRRWAEPLSDGIARVVREDLAPVADVEAAPALPKAPRLKLRVQAFEGLRSAGGILVKVSWRLEPGARGQFEAPSAAWDGKDYGLLAGLLSDVLGALAQQLAQKVWPRKKVSEKRPPEANEEPRKSGPKGVARPRKPVPAQ
jgi:uncharacterized lipoprotein YmbA